MECEAMSKVLPQEFEKQCNQIFSELLQNSIVTSKTDSTLGIAQKMKKIVFERNKSISNGLITTLRKAFKSYFWDSICICWNGKECPASKALTRVFQRKCVDDCGRIARPVSGDICCGVCR